MSGRLVNNDHRNIWSGDTVAERTASMTLAYTVSSVSKSSDTLVILTDDTSVVTCYKPTDSPVLECFPRHTTDMTVAHISDCGYIDFFRGQVSEYRQDEFSDHFCVYPSEVEKLFAAYQEWRIKHERKEISRLDWHDRTMARIRVNNAFRAENV